MQQKIEDFNAAKEPTRAHSSLLPKGVRDEPKVDNILEIELDFTPTNVNNGELAAGGTGEKVLQDTSNFNLIDLDFTNPNHVPVNNQAAPLNDEFDLLDFDIAPAPPIVQNQATQPPSDDLLDFDITSHSEPQAQQTIRDEEKEFSIF